MSTRLQIQSGYGHARFEFKSHDRGNPLGGAIGCTGQVWGVGNCRQAGFVCPFHGWRWNMDGENTFVYARQLFEEHQLERQT